MAKEKKRNPHCTVPDCRTKRPHIDDPVVKGLYETPPAALASWVKTGLSELINSMKADLEAGRSFAFTSRLRQTEELYHRALYALLLASPSEFPHVLSGDRPNGYTEVYRRVNEEIFDNRGALEELQVGSSGGNFTPMRMLNESAHGSFVFLLSRIGWHSNAPEDRELLLQYLDHLNRYWAYLNYIEGMFSAGKARADVLAGVRSIHKPAAAWKNPVDADSSKG